MPLSKNLATCISGIRQKVFDFGGYMEEY